MRFGRGDNDAAIFHRALEAGICEFDTAPTYNNGESERVLGKLIAGRREHVIISSKLGYRGLPSSTAAATEIAGSLRRLNVDYFDWLWLHRPIAPDVGYCATRFAARVGISNCPAWRVRDYDYVTAIQPMFSLLKRQAEVELFPLAAWQSFGVWTYSPLAAGLLTGKYPEGRLPDERYRARYARHVSQARAFVQLARAYGAPPAALALAWVIDKLSALPRQCKAKPIVGVRDVAQLEVALRAREYLPLLRDMAEPLQRVAPAPPPATDRDDER